MSEKVVRNDEISMRCGSVTLRIESIEDLYSMVSAQPLHLTLAAEEFSDPLDPLHRSRLDYTYVKNMNTTVLSGYVEFDIPDESSWSNRQAMEALYDYLVDEAGISETRIDEEFLNESAVFSVEDSNGAVVNISYYEEEDTAQLLLHTELPDQLTKFQTYETLRGLLRMWGDLHDYVMWVSDTDKYAPVDHEINIKKSTQPDAAYTLWQSILDYETWRDDMNMPDLPAVDHANIDLGKIGLALVSLERDEYDFIYPALQRLGTTLRRYGTGTISSGELIVALTT